MTTIETSLLTADDLLRLYSEGVRSGLIRGMLCEAMTAGQRHGAIAMILGPSCGTSSREKAGVAGRFRFGYLARA